MFAQVYRAAWEEDKYGGQTYHMLQLVGRHQSLISISAGITKKHGESAEIYEMVEGRRKLVAVVRKDRGYGREKPIKYRRIINRIKETNLSQCLIWSARTEREYDGEEPIGIGVREEEYYRNMYQTISRHISIPLKEEWLEWLLPKMKRREYIKELSTINCRAAALRDHADGYIADRVRDHLRGQRR